MCGLILFVRRPLIKTLSILGSTGSIGTNTLRVTSEFPDLFRVAGLAGGKNAAVLADQVERIRPGIASCLDEATSEELQRILRKRGYPLAETRFVYGMEGNIQVACWPESSIVLSAITGAAGLIPTYRAVSEGKQIALANKETLVMAGQLMMETARAHGVQILPVDSEHNAIHQCLRNSRLSEVRRLILTASGDRSATHRKRNLPRSLQPGPWITRLGAWERRSQSIRRL
jgi:1-deoxy-D-xylulose-5-phosphate reductoisomerase